MPNLSWTLESPKRCKGCPYSTYISGGVYGCGLRYPRCEDWDCYCRPEICIKELGE